MDNWINKKSNEIPSSLEFNIKTLDDLKIEGNILDIGCGNGNLCELLSDNKYNYYGIDYSIDAIETAKEKYKNNKNANFWHMSADKLEFDNEFFDFIIIKAVLTVIDSSEKRKNIMSEINRTLKKNGYVYIADFAQTWHNRLYRNRYIENYKKTNELGLFEVFDNNGTKIYNAKHFTVKEISDLYMDIGLQTYQFDIKKVKTRTGNIIDGYQIIAYKK